MQPLGGPEAPAPEQIVGDTSIQPAAAAEPVADVSNDYGALFAESFRAGGPAEDVIEPDPAETLEAVADTTVPVGDVEDAPSSSGDEAAPTTARTLNDWASILSDGPQRINEIPAAMRADAIRAMRDLERGKATTLQRQLTDAARATAQAKADGYKLAEERTGLAAQVADVDKVRTEQPAEFAEWVTNFPERYEQYLEAKRTLAAPPDIAVPATEPEASARSRIIASAAQQTDRLKEYPEAQTALIAKYATGFTVTDEALSKLTDDVTELLVEARVAQKLAETPKPADPVAVAANDRLAAAAALRAQPKTIAPGGSPPVDGIESVNDVSSLFAMGFQSANKKAASR